VVAERAEEVAEILARPFDSNDIEWRLTRNGVGKKGNKWAICVPYITARAVHTRLDEAFGSFNWRNEFRVEAVPGGAAGIICRTWYRHPDITDRQWEWKENGAGQSDIEPFKGGLSDAEKRAFEQLGGGRYLYSLEESFAEISETQSEMTPHYARTAAKDGNEPFYWGPPPLPDFAIPQARLGVIQASKTMLGGTLKLPQDFASFDRACDSHKGKRGINDLRMVGIAAKQRNWSCERLTQWIAEQGVDLEHAVEEDFTLLRSRMDTMGARQ
jgi:hypothetical protein